MNLLSRGTDHRHNFLIYLRIFDLEDFMNPKNILIFPMPQ